MFATCASWLRFCVNWREYWMNACTLPSIIVPAATRSPPTTAIVTYVRFPMKPIGRHDHAGDELRAEAGVVELVVLGAEPCLDLARGGRTP